MATINRISLNVRGLHAPGKRHSLYRELKRLRGDIVFLQETHLTHTTPVKLYAHHYPTWYYSLSDVTKAKGVAIGFRTGSSFTLEDTLVDPFGRFIFLKGSLGNLPCTLANVYASNQGQASFLTSTLSKPRDFSHGCIVLAGDFNTPMEPSLDTSQGRSSIPHRRLAFLRKQLHESQLIDVWRIMHPREKDYMHYSHLHSSSSHIEISTISDHAPISMQLHIPSLPRKTVN